MKVYFLHSGTPVQAEIFNETIHIRMTSVYDLQQRLFDKKELINAYAQMLSISKYGVDIQHGVLDFRNSPSHFFRSGFTFRRQVLAAGADLVHVTWGTFSALLAVIFSPVPVIISFCGSDIMGGYSPNGKKTWKSKLSIFLSQIAAFGARKIIAKSGKIKNAVRVFNRNKVTVIPNGVNLNSFHPQDKVLARKKLGWNENQPVILFFNVNGQTVKNRPLAESAMSIVNEMYPEAVLKIIENVPHHQLVNHYNAADALLLTSFHEGSNNSVKEALACNLPVVSVNCGDIEDRLLDVTPSTVVPSYDAQQLATALINILRNNTRSNGNVMIQQLSEENIAIRVIELYKEALKA